MIVKRETIYRFTLAAILVISFSTLISSSVNGQTGFVSTRAKEIVGPDGKPLLLKGINLGNWLEPEGYMFKFKEASSPRLINELLDELVGPDKAGEFWAAFRKNYITRADLEFIKHARLQFGQGSVRLSAVCTEGGPGRVGLHRFCSAG